jgi:O-acetyl-ADP-ribose deacetylase (regulator of RNase III)
MNNLKVNKSQITLVEGDITAQNTDAIVNPANDQLILGGGVAGAIRSKGGPAIQAACDEIGGTPAGTAVITTGGNLPAKFVIHAVGPRMGEGDEDSKLKSATLCTLQVAEENGLQSLTFPAISTGIFGYPIERCAKIMLRTVADYFSGNTGIREVRFCLWGQEAFGVFEQALGNVA